MAKIPSPGKLEMNLLEYVTQEGCNELINCYVDKLGAVHKRPGLVKTVAHYSVLGGIQAIYYWKSKDMLVIVAGGHIYAGQSLTESRICVTGAQPLLSHGAVKIADTGHHLYFASIKGPMVIWNGSLHDLAHTVVDAAPQNVSSIVYHNGRVIANDLGSNRFWYTAPPNLTGPMIEPEWVGYQEYGRTGVEIVGLASVGGELLVFKDDQFTAFYDDGTPTPFKPMIGSQHFYGLASASAMGYFDDSLFFITPNREIVHLLNRSAESISQPWIAREIEKLPNPAEARVFRLQRHILFVFPRSERTFAYDPRYQTWSEFTSHDAGIEKGFIARCATSMLNILDSASWIIGSSTGRIYFYEPRKYTDGDDPIKVLIRTPHLTWGTNNRKQSTRLVAKVYTKPRGDWFHTERYMEPGDRPGSGGGVLTPVIRCELYVGGVAVPPGVTVLQVLGLPAGLTATQSGRKLNITGTVTHFSGTAKLSVIYQDKYGGMDIQNIELEVQDPLLEVDIT